MGLEDRDWYWNDRTKRAKRYNPADPAADLPANKKNRLSKKQWQRFKRIAEEQGHDSARDWVWNDRKNHVELSQSTTQYTPRRKARTPKPKRTTTNPQQTINNLKWMLVTSVIINFMALHALWRLAHP